MISDKTLLGKITDDELFTNLNEYWETTLVFSKRRTYKNDQYRIKTYGLLSHQIPTCLILGMLLLHWSRK